VRRTNMKLGRVVIGAAAAAVLSGAAPAVAAETGVIKGVVVNETTGAPQAGASVMLGGAREDGSGRIVRRAVTDTRGRYRFTNLPAGDDRLYVVDVRHDGGLFPGSPLSIPSDTKKTPVIETRIRVWDTTTNPQTVLLARDNMFLTPGRGGIDVVESVTVANMTDLAYIGRGGSGAPTLGLALPADGRAGGIEIIDSDLDVPELLRTDFGAGLTIAIPPGQWKFTYVYRVRGIAGNHDLSRTALYPVVQTSVHAPEDVDVTSNRLVPNGNVTVGGTEYARWSATEAVEEGDQIQISATASADTNNTMLTAGIAAAIVLAAVLFAGTLWRNRRGPKVAPAAGERHDLMRAIAELDIRRDAGDIDEEEWDVRRAELKGRLARLPAGPSR
jgi:hypothetical protein